MIGLREEIIHPGAVKLIHCDDMLHGKSFLMFVAIKATRESIVPGLVIRNQGRVCRCCSS
jgi:hypothetical protein